MAYMAAAPAECGVEQTDRCLVALMVALHARDPFTVLHSQRVAQLAVLLAQRAGISGAVLEWVETGALMHDVGKIGVPDAILQKPDSLSALEFEWIKKHPAIGRQMASAIGGFPQPVLDIVSYHHERMDGRGYPDGLRAGQIPLFARVVAVADAWDAMTNSRSYRRALTEEAALVELVRGAGTQFDSELVDLFIYSVL